MSIASDYCLAGRTIPAELKPEQDSLECGAEPFEPRSPDGGARPVRPSTVQALLQNVMTTDTTAFLRMAATARPGRADPPGRAESKAAPAGPAPSAAGRGRAAGLRQGDQPGSAPSPNIYGATGARAAATTDSPARLQPVTKSLFFYFDFASPYGYLAALRLDSVAARHGLAVEWRPLPLGSVFGWAERAATPLEEFKAGYLQHDCERTARRHGAPFRLPECFPFDTMPACRAFYHVRREDAAGARRFARALLHAAFGAGGDITAAQGIVSAAIASGIGIERRGAVLHSPAGDQQLNRELQAAIRSGVFGSPFFVVDGEGFWGHDRLEDVAAWLARNGW